MSRNFIHWTATFSLVLTGLFVQSLDGQLATYNQDFEGLNMASPSALADEGWLVGANVFDPDGNFIYNYFAFPAPNGGPGFCSVATGSGGPNQGLQYINVYSDYNNADHGNGFTIDAYVFRDGVISSADFGMTYDFTFDFRRADDPFGPAASMETAAYIRVLDPFNNFNTVFEALTDTTGASFDWTEGSVLSVTVDPSWNQFFVQYGFNTNGTNFDPSGIFYDNISFGLAADCVLGDVNGDGTADLLDISAFVTAITTGTFSCAADVNVDGVVSLLDVAPFVAILTGG